MPIWMAPTHSVSVLPVLKILPIPHLVMPKILCQGLFCLLFVCVNWVVGFECCVPCNPCVLLYVYYTYNWIFVTELNLCWKGAEYLWLLVLTVHFALCVPPYISLSACLHQLPVACGTHTPERADFHCCEVRCWHAASQTNSLGETAWVSWWFNSTEPYI